MADAQANTETERAAGGADASGAPDAARSQNDGALLLVEDLHVRYGAVAAVRGVTLEVSRGQIVVLLGVNGAGKTSVLNAIAGAAPLASGRVVLGGAELKGGSPEAAVARGVGLAPEGRRIFASLTVRENLRLGGGFMPRREFADRLAELLELFPVLGARLDANGGELSGGQQQQLAIARALVRRPQVLLLDEPSLGLAPKVMATVFELIARLGQGGITILLVEQNARHALAFAQYGYVLQAGRVVLQGRPDTLRQADIESAYLGLPAAEESASGA